MYLIFKALVRRDLKVLQQTLFSNLIDSVITTCCFYLVYGNLMPLLGMRTSLVPAIFIGMLGSIILNLLFFHAQQTAFDLEFHRTIDYYSTLPISTNWLIARYVFSNFLSVFLSSIPIFIGGRMLFGNLCDFSQGSILLTIFIYCLTLLMLTILVMTMVFYASYRWFNNNMWSRFLNPLLFLGCEFVPWKSIFTLSPLLSALFAISPVTYALEGLRYALTGSPQYLSPYLCIPLLLAWIFLGTIALQHTVKKRLDIINLR